MLLGALEHRNLRATAFYPEDVVLVSSSESSDKPMRCPELTEAMPLPGRRTGQLCVAERGGQVSQRCACVLGAHAAERAVLRIGQSVFISMQVLT